MSRRPGLLARSGIVLLLTCAGAVAAVGGISLAGSGLLAVVLAAVVSGCLAAGIARDTPSWRRRPIEVAWRAAVTTVAVLLVLNGLAVVAGSAITSGLVGAAVLAVVARWAVRATRAERRSRTVAAVVPLDVPGDVRSLSVPELGREWVRTSAVLREVQDTAVRQGLVRRRQEALDELERRDPVGFARWLASGATVDDDPTVYVAERPRDEGPAGSQAA
ncbi:hypothetical protein [Modestobacter marinus]|uniref:hypothetical protein n=1 Tax=Modestobacter marinus TaxID=477641 RepID=UPI001C95EFEE|nr:hypothetical protein [Modestobacter marinus]